MSLAKFWAVSDHQMVNCIHSYPGKSSLTFSTTESLPVATGLLEEVKGLIVFNFGVW
jgi:hypothetical protein